MAEDKTKKKAPGGSLPDTGKGADTGLEDDQPEIPNMGEGVDLEAGDVGAGEGPAPVTEPLDLSQIPELREVAMKRGFKSAADIVKTLEGLEQQNTKLSQELRVSKLQATLPPPRRAGSFEAPVQPAAAVEDPYELVQDKNKFNAFMQTTGKQWREELKKEIRQEEADKEYDKAYRQANALMAKDPEKFEKLRPIMHQLSLQDPNANLEELYARAETKRKEDIEELRKEVLGDIDPNSLKIIAAHAKPAGISSASGGGQQATGGTEGKTAAQIIKEQILLSDRLSD
jgi:hypothetical protein